MLTAVTELTYAIVLCDDIRRMKAFYRDLFGFVVDSETETSLALRAGGVLLGLRERTRAYDGRGVRRAAAGETPPGAPGVQLAFRVRPDQVDQCYHQLVAKGVVILEPPTDQPRRHRTVYFADPEGNLLEVYAEI